MSRRFLLFWKTKAKTKKRTQLDDSPVMLRQQSGTPRRLKALSEVITPEELIRKNVQARTALEIQLLLKESVDAEVVCALADHLDLTLPGALLFRKGEVIKVVSEDESGICHGLIFNGGTSVRTGVFPASLVFRSDQNGKMQTMDEYQTKALQGGAS
ncbi:uncharacterized protein LOC123515556 isoform X3 [Portunus trituberculatus]|uniref:uncharacterized protein LOC123515556 isoform X3 n=1 Tax=Portunus trituberculatus TaxID=210409 RepID=UPI001E1CB3E7|nr:uncharacterized protein LOC123515556 isoform X3 [Portunus trituberculatus]